MVNSQSLRASALDDGRSLRRFHGSSQLIFELGAEPDPFDGWLGLGEANAALSRLRADGTTIVVALPNHTTVDEKTHALSGPREKLLLAHADRLVGRGGRDLTPSARLVAAASRTVDRFRLQIADNSDISEDLGEGVFSILIEACTANLRETLVALGANLPATDPDSVLARLGVFVKEATDNVRLHATHSVPDDARKEGIAVFYAARMSVDAISTLSSPSTELQQWLDGMRRRADRSGGPNLEALHILISDSGDGIPATMKEDLRIYSGPLALELKAIDDALRPKHTRPRTRPTVAPSSLKGFGLPQILDKLDHLRGYISISTGRSVVERSMILASGDRRVSQAGEQGLYQWTSQEVDLQHGTTLSVLLPLDFSRPLQEDSLFDHLGND